MDKRILGIIIPIFIIIIISFTLFSSNLFPNNNLTILDFFAGSGTTGHALLKYNSKDKGQRKFIICTNNENNICRNHENLIMNKSLFIS